MTRRRVGTGWWVADLAPVLIYGIAVALLRVARGSWTNVGALGHVNYLPPLGAGALVVWFLTFGIGEETGWRGFALPRLQRDRSALAASLTLAAFWIVWHLPSFLYLESYVRLGAKVIPGFALGLMAGAVVFTWMYNGSGGSVLIAALGHATLNLVTASPDGDQTINAIVSTVVMVWAVVIVLVWKPATLSRAPKQVG